VSVYVNSHLLSSRLVSENNNIWLLWSNIFHSFYWRKFLCRGQDDSDKWIEIFVHISDKKVRDLNSTFFNLFSKRFLSKWSKKSLRISLCFASRYSYLKSVHRKDEINLNLLPYKKKEGGKGLTSGLFCVAYLITHSLTYFTWYS